MAVAAERASYATARSRKRFSMLEELGASRVELERSDMAAHIAESKQIDAVLDLVGNSTILDSLDMLRRGGRPCLAGWLGGLDPIGDFNPLLRMASGVQLELLRQLRVWDSGFSAFRRTPTRHRAAGGRRQARCKAVAHLLVRRRFTKPTE